MVIKYPAFTFKSDDVDNHHSLWDKDPEKKEGYIQLVDQRDAHVVAYHPAHRGSRHHDMVG